MTADRQSRKRPRPRLETLEERAVFSAGILDSAFGGDRMVTTPIGPADDFANAVAIQTDGKILAAGYALNGSDYDFALARYRVDGTLDPAFGGDGKVTTPIGTSTRAARGLAIQADGRIVAVGSSFNDTDDDFALARYNADGSLDTTFDGDGTLTTTFGPSGEIAYGVAIQVDGKIVAAGYSTIDGNLVFALARYNPDGSLDASFGGDGRVTTPIGPSTAAIRGVTIQTDGKIVAAGLSLNGSTYDFALARYLPDGGLDPTFDSDGVLTTSVGAGNDAAYGIALQGDGKILAAGYSHNGTDNDFALARYNADGSLDSSFDGDGRVTTPVGGLDDAASGVAVQADGRIVVVGSSVDGGGNDFAVARYNADGSSDITFSWDGKLTTAISGSDDFAEGVAIQADGKIVTVGAFSQWGSYDFALLRYAADGSLDALADGDGTVTSRFGFQGGDGHGIAIQPDDKIVVAGSAGYPAAFFSLVRYNPDGSPDVAFGDAGLVITLFNWTPATANAVAIQDDGKIVAAGQAYNGSNFDFAVVRYNTDGSLDTTFDGDGKVTTAFGLGNDSASGVVIQADGRILVVGSAWTDHAVYGLARYLPDGRLDVTFDLDGKVTSPNPGGSPFAQGVAIQANGKIVAAGYLTIGSNTDVVLYQFNPDGSLDAYVDVDGNPSDDRAYAVAVQVDGKIVVVGSSLNGTDHVFALSRYNADFSLDATFGGDGKLTTALGDADDIARSLAIQADGKIVVAGSSVLGGNTLFALARYLPNGSLDLSFDGDGTLTAAVGGGGVANAVAVQPDGKIVAAGTDGSSFALLRVLGDNRAPVTVPTILTLAEDATLVVDRPAYLYDPDGDAATTELLVTPAHGTLALTPYGNFTYTPAPNFNGTDQFTYQVSDTFGASAIGTVVLDVTPVPEAVEVSDDPALPGKRSLFVTGTPGDDAIAIKPVGRSRTAYLVTRNGGPAETVTGVTGRVYVTGLDGNDSIQLKPVKIPVRLNGGPGNDTLISGAGADFLTGGPGDDFLDGRAGADRLVEAGDVSFTLVQGTARTDGRLTGLGADVLVRNRVEQADLTGGSGGNRIDASAFTGRTWLRGGGGSDTLRGGRSIDLLLGGDGDDDLDGGAGRDVLIGGLGADWLVGGAGADLLIGGVTAHDGNAPALDAVLAEWTGGAGYTARVRHLLGTLAGGRNGGSRLDATTVLDDAGAADDLNGGLGMDWFGTGPGDKADQMSREQVLIV